MGVTLTEGLGAGANPQIGEQSAVDSLEQIKAMLNTNTKMIFITAGMGGATGTGASVGIGTLPQVVHTENISEAWMVIVVVVVPINEIVVAISEDF